MLEGQAGGQVRRRGQVMSLPRVPIKTKQLMSSNRMGMVNQPFHCKVCEVSVNSETQLKQVGKRWFCERDACEEINGCLSILLS